MRLSHDEYFLQMLELVAARSTCTRRAVGAIITDVYNKILSTGYNGVPRGMVHCIDVACIGAIDLAGDSSRCEAVHAEVNAILQCSAIERAHTFYVSCTPCFTCAKMICNTSIKRVVVLEPYADQAGQTMLSRARIEIIVASQKK